MARKRKAGKKDPKPSPRELEELRLLEGLEEVARKIGIEVVHDHIQAEGVRSRGGACRVEGENLVLIDRKLGVSDKVDLLASELARHPLDDVFIPPALRQLIHPSTSDG